MTMESQDIQEVRKANEEFYRAFQSLALDRMQKVWLKEEYVRCIHPGWNLILGYDPVMESWSRIFQNTTRIQFMLTDVSVNVSGSLAWVVLTENLTSELPGGSGAQGSILATNLYEKRDGVWYLIHHHASTIAFSHGAQGPTTLH